MIFLTKGVAQSVAEHRARAEHFPARSAADPVRAGEFPAPPISGVKSRALGGPTTYSDDYGSESSVVQMHSGNGPHEEMDRRAIACFDQALADIGFTAEPLRGVLYDYFAWATTTTMARYHESADVVPQGMRIPRWSWDGLQT
ncbi:MAG: oxidoreductase [Pseudomonadota bacterium]